MADPKCEDPLEDPILTESGLSLEFGYQDINNTVRDVWTAGDLGA